MKICAVSDLHGNLPAIPPCDLLLIAGDVCPDFGPGTGSGLMRQRDWLSHEFANWIISQPCRAWAATYGNHDFVQRCAAGFETDSLAVFAGLRVWFSPWSNTFGGWAWMQSPAALRKVYDAIPADVDILVSHQPPYGYGDEIPDEYLIFQEDKTNRHVGSRELLATIERVRPRVVICGHIHGGYGRYEHNGTTIYNVSVVDDAYRLTNHPTLIDLSFLTESNGTPVSDAVPASTK